MKRVLIIAVCAILAIPAPEAPAIAGGSDAAGIMLGLVGAAMGAALSRPGYRRGSPRVRQARAARRAKHSSAPKTSGGDPFAGSGSSVPSKLQ